MKKLGVARQNACIYGYITSIEYSGIFKQCSQGTGIVRILYLITKK